MNGPDLAVPAPDACVHRGVAVDRAGLKRKQVVVIACAGDAPPLVGVAAALMFPGYYGGTWDALDECLGDLAQWWPARGWVVVVNRAQGADWRLLEECWRHAASGHARAGRSLHLVYDPSPALA